MTLWIKICGLTSEEAVDAAVAAGVDAVGFVFHAASPRNVTPDQAARMAQRVPAGVERIAVTRHPTQALIDELFATFQPDVLQTDARDFPQLALPPAIGCLPVLRTGEAMPSQWPARCLYEGAHSGQGQRADWHEAARLSTLTRLILAGGLDAATVAQAVSQVRPYGVDVSSGVESTPGRKDVEKMYAFVTAARAAATH
jgi:phosphoribosylanthranilate isomerase